jgi:H+/Cl- antiporter ClcA
MIIFSIMFRGKDVWEAGGGIEEATSVRDMAFGFVLVFAILALLLGLLGVSTIWIKNRCCNICLSLLLFPTWLIILIFGVVCLVVSGVSDALGQEFCKGTTDLEAKIAEAQEEALADPNNSE